MKSFILVALCLLSIKLASAHPAVPCHGTTYFDCYHYCYGSCRGLECFHRCQSGCGCEEAFIVRNNGACWKVEVCQVGDDDADPGTLMSENVGRKSSRPCSQRRDCHPSQRKLKIILCVRCRRNITLKLAMVTILPMVMLLAMMITMVTQMVISTAITMVMNIIQSQ
ncbi:uncharacterized protein LOC108159615 [Drosophila miranda]|uniref:uncharacterized protein LOC108159615 n=1 Tax=Drosophila miranda TaxID=7229 RepID=UPI00143F87F2|nr:uncharacterized protein LOC108159615 [Drosophila miranda]